MARAPRLVQRRNKVDVEREGRVVSWNDQMVLAINSNRSGTAGGSSVVAHESHPDVHMARRGSWYDAERLNSDPEFHGFAIDKVDEARKRGLSWRNDIMVQFKRASSHEHGPGNTVVDGLHSFPIDRDKFIDQSETTRMHSRIDLHLSRVHRPCALKRSQSQCLGNFSGRDGVDTNELVVFEQGAAPCGGSLRWQNEIGEAKFGVDVQALGTP